MSGRLIGQVYGLQLERAQQAIAVALADHGRDDGSGIYPGLAFLGWKTGYSRRHILRVMRELEGLGLLVRAGRRRTARGEVQAYRMVVDGVPRKPPFRAELEAELDADSGPDEVGGAAAAGAIDGTVGVPTATGAGVTNGTTGVPTATAPGAISDAAGANDDTQRYEYPRPLEPYPEPSLATVPEPSARTGGGAAPAVAASLAAEASADIPPPAAEAEGGLFEAVCAVCCSRPGVISRRAEEEVRAVALTLERAGYGAADVERFGRMWFGKTAPHPRQVQDRIEAVLSSREKSHDGTGYRDRAAQRDAEDAELRRVLHAAALGRGGSSAESDRVSGGGDACERARFIGGWGAGDFGDGDGLAGGGDRLEEGVSDLGVGEGIGGVDH